MNKKYLITLGLLALIGIVVLGWQLLQPSMTPANLANRALTAASSADRVQAAIFLTMVRNTDALPYLQRVATESKDADVTVIAINGLAPVARWDCLPLLLDDMNHEQPAVRKAAYDGVREIMGPSLPESFKFEVDAAPPQRQAAVQQVRDIIAKENADAGKDKLLANAAAAGYVPPAATVSASPGTMPSLYAGSSAPLSGYESPALTFLSWLFRGLALLMLVAVLGGTISLLVGDLGAAWRARGAQARKGSLTAAEEVAMAAARNSTETWNKVAMLLKGAVGVVALLTVAEFIPMAAVLQQIAVAMQQSAVRVEQKIDTLSHK